MITRRAFVESAAWTAVLGRVPCVTTGPQEPPMYGLIGRIKATPGQRDALASILVEAASSMPGCLSYVVARDADDPDALWVTEAWDSQASHQASLSLPAVQEAIAAGRPLIAEFTDRFATEPVGGHGLVRS